MLEWLNRLPRPHSWRRPPSEAKRNIHVVLSLAEDGTWGPATIVSGRPMVQLVAELTVRNLSEHKLMLVSAKLRKPATEGLVRVHDRDRGTSGTFPLEPSASTRVSVYFFVAWSLPPLSAGTNVVGDVGVVDQFGNVHWLEKVRFRSRVGVGEGM